MLRRHGTARLYIEPLFPGVVKDLTPFYSFFFFHPRVIIRRDDGTRGKPPFTRARAPRFPFFAAPRKFADDLIRLITLTPSAMHLRRVQSRAPSKDVFATICNCTFFTRLFFHFSIRSKISR